jgi:hypothetical protein
MARSARTSTSKANDDRPIAYAKIFPAIGIARVGDSPDDFFYGPEFLPPVAEKPENFRYRDAQRAIKRQAARFRIYGFDAENKVVGEITSATATVTWKVHLANKKAAWFEFNGAAMAAQQFADAPAAQSHPLRNAPDRVPGAGSIRVNSETGRFESDDDRKTLEIDGGEKSISGINQRPADDQNDNSLRFKGFFKRSFNGYAGHEVYLGELRTDDAGRLIVLGGRGKSTPVGSDGPVSGDDRLAYWIVSYANNDHWHDDISDGPVTATVRLQDGSPIRVEGGAWVIVAPPDFAPDVTNLMTLYDVMEETAIAGRIEPTAGCPKLRNVDVASFQEDIAPILLRMNDYRWVSPLGLRGHGYNKPGAAAAAVFEEGEVGDGALSSAERENRERFFNGLRVPNYPGLDPDTGQPATIDNDLAVAQATSFYMPPLSGDEGDRTAGVPQRWLTLTRLQYARMERWKDGRMRPSSSALADDELEQVPARLTRNVLEACSGGAFFPGIEMTVIARDPSLFSEPFRIDHSRVAAGDISKYMACPWQADFYECRDAWWPAQRPDEVITDLTFEELLKSFSAERRSGFESVMFRRERWDRGLERKPRPSLDYLRNKLLPEPGSRSAEEYADSVAETAVGQLLALIPGWRRYRRYATEPLPGGAVAQRLPNPWRLQFLVQEQLDGYSGRYFLPTIPSPEEAIKLDDIPAQFDPPAGPLTLPAIRRDWASLRMTHPPFAGYVLGTYALEIAKRLQSYVTTVVLSTPVPKGKEAKEKTLAPQVKYNVENATSEPSTEPQEFEEDSDAFCRLRAGEFVDQIVSSLFLSHSEQAPDMAMVDEWRNMGFVRRKTIAADKAKNIPALTIQIETERDKFDGKSFRDYFYYLMNIDKFPDFVSYAQVLATQILDAAQRLIDRTSVFDPRHPESFVEYTPANFAAKMEQIYEILRARASIPQRYVYRTTRNERIQALLGNGPFNQTDGAWLRYAANAGTIDEITSLLFAVWSDEVGNGDPALHHGNLYSSLLKSLGVYLPEVASRAYADDPRFGESTFVAPVFQLAISQHSQSFFPEIIGMTLFLEWEVLSLVPGIKALDYFGIDSQFFRMHVGIDNATDGHGAKAKRAVELYLDQVFKEGGAEAQQEHWKRVWRGFVAFATAGYDLFQNVGPTLYDGMTIEGERARHARTPADRVAEIMRRKLHYGSLNHVKKHLGLYRINDLFDQPDLFLTELANSPWIAPGKPDDSRFLGYLTTFQGPMYKVFSPSDLATWRGWIEWLGREGDTLRSKRHLSRGEAMMLLIIELRQLMISSEGHQLYHVPMTASGKGAGVLLADLFRSGDLKDIMRTLKDPRNGWIVPYRPAESALVADLMRPGRTMGTQLDRRIPQLFDQIGRMIVYEWIAAGCPIPGERAPDAARAITTRRPEPRLFVQQYGMGAVH